MARYILIDNYSGFIWGDTGDLNGPERDESPLDATRRLDENEGREPHEYEEHGPNYRPALNAGAYHVYRADTDIELVEDGQDQEVIEVITRDCRKVAVVTWTQAQE